MATQTFTPTQLVGQGNATIAATQNVPLAADTHYFANTGREFVRFDKGAGTAVVTVVTGGNVRGVAIADPTYSLAASTECQYIGPFAPDVFNDPATGLVSFTVSEATGMTCEVVRFPTGT